jgi:hypothetical protein
VPAGGAGKTWDLAGSRHSWPGRSAPIVYGEEGLIDWVLMVAGA